jgi:hypothetical protein
LQQKPATIILEPELSQNDVTTALPTPEPLAEDFGNNPKKLARLETILFNNLYRGDTEKLKFVPKPIVATTQRVDLI